MCPRIVLAGSGVTRGGPAFIPNFICKGTVGFARVRSFSTELVLVIVVLVVKDSNILSTYNPHRLVITCSSQGP